MEAALTFAFSAGMLASVNPCGFAMLPAFVAFYVSEDSTREQLQTRLLRAVLLGGVTTAGFLIVFLVAGGIFFAGGRFIVRLTPWAGAITGGLLILIGGWTLFTGRLPFTLPIPTPGWQVKKRTPGAMLLYGVAYALVSLSCTIPVFLSVVAGAISSGNWAVGLLSFVFYGLGMGSVITFIALSTALFEASITRKIRWLVPHVKTVGAVALIIAGAYLIYQQVINPFVLL